MNSITSTRLQIALNLVLEEDGDLVFKTLILEGLKEEDSVVKNVLDFYGVA